MPVQETDAKLWFKTQQEKDEYDDKMIASIELKSSDFNDENFSPVFNRVTKEFFLQPGEKMKNDNAKIQAPILSATPSEIFDKYIVTKPDHSFYREATIEKFIAGFGIGYLILRELPVRNFYARCFIMQLYAAKLFDHTWSIFPYNGMNGKIVAASDNRQNWDVKCYDNAYSALKYINIPTAMNKLSESKIWYAKQPAHLKREDGYWMPHHVMNFRKKEHQVSWDGTMNMPIYRLADPKHKDAYMIIYR